MDRLLNYTFLFFLILLFTLGISGEMHYAIIIGIPVAVVCGLLVFVLQWLTLRGAAAAIVVGIVTFGVGGWALILALLTFFVSSVLISISDHDEDSQSVRRDGLQVWANGFWLCTWLVTGVLTHEPVFWMTAAAALAVAAADTWATELGSRRFEAKTYDASSHMIVPSGRQGGVSVPGLWASLTGSAVISLVFCLGFSAGTSCFFVITIAGFIGGLFDSYLGATRQGRSYRIHGLQSHGRAVVCIDNNMVNWLSTGFGSILFLIFNLIFL